jgi:hypothetical protein
MVGCLYDVALAYIEWLPVVFYKRVAMIVSNYICDTVSFLKIFRIILS